MWYDSTGTIGGSWLVDVYGEVDLRTDFGDSVRTEGSLLGDYLVVAGQYNAEVTIGAQTYNVPAVKEADGLYAWGIGPIRTVFWEGPTYALSYAKIDGVEIGAPVVTTTVSRGLPAKNGMVSLPYPNPNNGRFSLEVHSTEASALRILVVDSLGRVVWQRIEPARHPGSSRLDLNVQGLATGTYFIQIIAGDERYRTMPFVLIH